MSNEQIAILLLLTIGLIYCLFYGGRFLFNENLAKVQHDRPSRVISLDCWDSGSFVFPLWRWQLMLNLIGRSFVKRGA